MSQEELSVALGLYSTPKTEFLQGRRQIIVNMRNQINSLERKIKKMDPESFEYKQTVKAIARRKEIIKNCEQDIFVIQAQMNSQTNARFRGI